MVFRLNRDERETAVRERLWGASEMMGTLAKVGFCAAAVFCCAAYGRNFRPELPTGEHVMRVALYVGAPFAVYGVLRGIGVLLGHIRHANELDSEASVEKGIFRFGVRGLYFFQSPVERIHANYDPARNTIHLYGAMPDPKREGEWVPEEFTVWDEFTPTIRDYLRARGVEVTEAEEPLS